MKIPKVLKLTHTLYTMQEIEVKILEIDVPAFKRKLASIGAKKVFEGNIIASKFDTPTKQLEKNDQLLRLRTRGDIVELTFKKKQKSTQAKIVEETEVTVSDYKAMKTILQEIGFIESGKQHKTRISYALGDDVHIEIDTFPGIPPFAEIETHNLKRLKEVVALLGYTMEDTKPWSGSKVIEYYKRKK